MLTQDNEEILIGSKEYRVHNRTNQSRQERSSLGYSQKSLDIGQQNREMIFI